MDIIINAFKSSPLLPQALRADVTAGQDTFPATLKVLPQAAIRPFYALIANVEEAREFLEKNFGTDDSKFPEASRDRAPHGLDSHYTFATPAEQFVMRFVGSLGMGGSEVAAMMANLASAYRAYQSEVISPPRTLVGDERSLPFDKVLGHYRVGPYLFRHLIENNEFAGTTEIRNGLAKFVFSGTEIPWESGTIKASLTSSLTKLFATERIRGKAIKFVSCPALAHAFSVFMSAVEVVRDDRTKTMVVRPLRSASASEASRVLTDMREHQVLCNNLSLVIAKENNAHVILNEIQVEIMERSAADARYLFTRIDPARAAARTAATASLNAVSNLATLGATLTELFSMQKQIDEKDKFRNAGGKAKVFNGNASYYGDGLPEMANYAKYIALVQELARLAPKSQLHCHSDSDALHLKQACDHEKLRPENWDQNRNSFRPLDCTNFIDCTVIYDGYKRLQPKDHEVGDNAFMDNANYLASLEPACFAVPWKCADVLNQSPAKFQSIIESWPPGYEMKFVKGGKFHTTDFYLIGLKSREVSEVTAKGYAGRLKGAIRKVVQVAFAFEKYISASTAYGIQLHCSSGFPLIEKLMPSVLEKKATEKETEVRRPFKFIQDSMFRPYVGDISYTHTAVNNRVNEVYIKRGPDDEEEEEEAPLVTHQIPKIEEPQLETPVLSTSSSSSRAPANAPVSTRSISHAIPRVANPPLVISEADVSFGDTNDD